MPPGPQDSEPSWPPRSPREALLSTPKGRQRYQDMLNQTSPLSSPARHTRALASIISRTENIATRADDDEDEDEETLQLKLQEIQARLKLKRLQNAKAKEFAASSRTSDESLWSESFPSGIQPRRSLRGTAPVAEVNSRPRSQSAVQVPASPVRKLQAAQQPPTSPSRVLLGIDKGLKAKDVSLKRAPSFRKMAGNDGATQNGGYLQRSKAASPSAPKSPDSRIMSFNERLASARAAEAFRAERQEKIRNLRSNAFGIGKEEMEQYKKNAVEIPDEPLAAPAFTRDEVLGKSKPAAGPLRRTNTLPNLRSATSEDMSDSASASQEQANNSATGATPGEQSSFEPYSSIHLSKRILPHTVLARHVSGKKILNIKDLLKEVKAPDFALPDIEQDIVVFAIVAKKSDPRAHKPAVGKNGAKTEDRGKYMVMTLVDLEFELDLFLFNSGFNRYWKLTEGTVVAILNPNVMPPPPGRQDTGRFSLVINSDEDTILEIGSARDLGFCQSIKKDGQLCAAWVNKKRTQFCEFHSNEALRKQRGNRMEVNSSGFGGRERYKPKSREISDNGKNKDNYDWETKTHWFVSRGHSAADLIDGKSRDPADRKEKAEFLKRSMEAKERERDMMKKLGQIGNAAGREYMQRAGSSKTGSGLASSFSSSHGPNSAETFDEPDRQDASALGFLGKDREIHLSPIKRKRTGSSQAGSFTRSSSSTSSTANASRPLGYGWGGALKEKLANMKDGEKFKPELPPVRKKTRFVTDKGIREAGRESLGNLAERLITLEDDDDDELVILK